MKVFFTSESKISKKGYYKSSTSGEKINNKNRLIMVTLRHKEDAKFLKTEKENQK